MVLQQTTRFFYQRTTAGFTTIIFLCLAVLALAHPITVSAQGAVCEQHTCSKESSDYEGCLTARKACFQDKLNETVSTKNSLNRTITILSSQIALQEVKISETQLEISKLTRSIGELQDRIAGLDVSLDSLGATLVKRVTEQYKLQSLITPVTSLGTQDVQHIISELKYLKLAKEQTAKAMQLAEHQRLNYDEQKALLEVTQKELDQKQNELKKQQDQVAQQRNEQQNILKITQNDESTYQRLIREAERELASLRNYVTSRGGASILSGTTRCDDWGCYYNQRDSQWGNQSMGQSSTSVAVAGCLVASSAMVASHYGKQLDPGAIASAGSAFSFNLLKNTFTVDGVTVSRNPRACSGTGCLPLIDNELEKGRPVIVRINAVSVSGHHFIVITKKDGDNYIMKDPLEADGNNISFTSKHAYSQLSRVDYVSVN